MLAFVGAAAALATPLLGHPSAALALAVAASLFLLSLLGRWSVQSAEVLELAPGRLLEGETRSLELRGYQHSRLPGIALRMRVNADHLSLRGEAVLLPPGPFRSVTAAIRGLRRGRIQNISLHLASTAPFGLLRFSRRMNVEADVWVLPRARALRESVFEQMLQLRPRGLDLPQPSGPGESEFFALREFRDGDPERRVHHRLTARRGRKILRLFQGEAPPRVDLVLDQRVPTQRQTFQKVDFEEAVRFCAGILRALLVRNVQVTLHVVDRESVQRAVPPNCRDLYTFLAALALVQPLPEVGTPDSPPLPTDQGEEGRKVLVHLGMVHEAAVGRSWIVIEAGSRNYYQLLEPQFVNSDAR